MLKKRSTIKLTVIHQFNWLRHKSNGLFTHDEAVVTDAEIQDQ